MRGSLAVDIDASCWSVFEVVHDYSRRLEWDTLLSRADILGSHTAAGVGVRTLCVGRPLVGGVSMETEYVSFVPGKVAAVKLVSPRWPFQAFAASIQHLAAGNDASRVIYTYSFTSNPAFLRWLVEPIIGLLLKRETLRRLQALKRYVETNGVANRSEY